MKKQHYILLGVLVIIVAIVFIADRFAQKRDEGMMNFLATSTATSTHVATTVSQSISTSPQPVIGIGAVQPTYVPKIVRMSTTLKVGESDTVGKLIVTVKDLRDTRCATTKCDTSDNARVTLGVKGPFTSKNVSLTEQQAFYVDDIKVTLQSVLPVPQKNKTIKEGDYRVTLLIESIQ